MNTTEKNPAAVSFGKLGGDANFKKNGKKHMSRIGKKGAKSLWKSRKKKK